MAIFTNQATISYNGTVANSNIATGEIREALSIEKLAVLDTYSVGDDKTYIISIVNSCGTDADNVTVTDNLGVYEFNGQTVYPLTYNEGSLVYFVDGVVTTAPAVTAENGLTITGITVPANSNVLLVYSARVNEFASPETDGEITNTVALSSAIYGVLTASESITALNTAELSISKAISPQSVADCEQLMFTFVIQNSGNTPATAQDSVVLSDTFEIALENLTVTLDGAPLIPGTDYTYDSTTGVFSTTAGRITVPAATFEQAPTGEWTTNPGSATLVITADV